MKTDQFVGIALTTLFTGFILGCTLGGLIGHNINVDYYQRKAIEHNAAQYNPDTGQFEWLEQEDKE